MTNQFATFVMLLTFTFATSAEELSAPPKSQMYKCYNTIMREFYQAGVIVDARDIHPNIIRHESTEKYWRKVNGADVLELVVNARGQRVFYHMFKLGTNHFSCSLAQTRGLPR